MSALKSFTLFTSAFGLAAMIPATALFSNDPDESLFDIKLTGQGVK